MIELIIIIVIIVVVIIIIEGIFKIFSWCLVSSHSVLALECSERNKMFFHSLSVLSYKIMVC